MSLSLGYWQRTDLAAEQLEKLLFCEVCNKIVDDPCVLKSCGHFFCRKCMAGVVGENCPQCGIPNHVKDMVPSRQLLTMVSLCRKLRRITNGGQRSQCTSDVEEIVDKENLDEPDHSVDKEANQTSNGLKPCVKTLSTPKVLVKKSTICTPHSASPKPGKRGGRSNKNTNKNTAKSPKPYTRPSRTSLQSPQSLGSPAGRLNTRVSQKSVQSPKTPVPLEKKNAKGETQLHVATIKGDIKRLQELLSLGANPNVKDNAGWTPLHEAVNHGYLEISQTLLSSGVLVNTPGPDNDTPLHDAVASNRLECAKLLVTHGASIEQRNVHGLTPLDMAKTEEMKDMLKTTEVEDSRVSDMTPSSTPLLKSSHLVIMGTGLRRDQKSQLTKCASMLQATCFTDFSNEVTHVISSTNGDGMCPRTLKYLQAVLTGKWILRFEWVEQCLSYGQSVCEEAFEIPGSSTSVDSLAPMKGRQNVEKQLPGLFDGFQFYLSGTFKYPTPSKDELTQLIKLGGGKILTREPKLDTLDDLDVTVPYHAGKNKKLKDCGHLIVYDPNDKKAKKICNARLCSVPATWVMDCVAHFDILDLPK